MNITSHVSKSCFVGIVAVLALITGNRANAQNLPAPVSGLKILDLANPTSPILLKTTLGYSASFVATSSLSTVTFVFRQDPGFFVLTNTSVIDTTHVSANLLLNPDFQINSPTAPGAGVPDWTYFIQTGNTFPQFLGFEEQPGFIDGSTQAYDGIDQTFATTMGDTYDVSFDLSSTTGGGVYQQTSTNGDTTNTGGNGIDAVVYAGNGLPPTSVPDTSMTCLLVAGSVLALFGMRRQVKAVRQV
jgi:hypothetical protein